MKKRKKYCIVSVFHKAIQQEDDDDDDSLRQPECCVWHLVLLVLAPGCMSGLVYPQQLFIVIALYVIASYQPKLQF